MALCKVCKSDRDQFISAKAGSKVLEVFEITTPHKALIHLQRGKKSSAFCTDDLSALIRDKSICSEHIESYVAALQTCSDLASEHDPVLAPVTEDRELAQGDGTTAMVLVTTYADGSTRYG